VLTPEELKLPSRKALARYQQLFAGVGSLDRVLLDFYERTKALPEDQRRDAPLIEDENDHAGLALQYAAITNVATQTNRPDSFKGKGSKGVLRNFFGTFMGWVVNMMKQFSKVLQVHSGDKNFTQVAHGAIGLLTIVALSALVGAWNWEFGDELTKWLFNVSSARIQPGNIQDVETAAKYAVQALVNTIPMYGSYMGSLAGLAFTGRGTPFDMASLSPQIGFISDFISTTKRMIQTGDAQLPLLDFARRWGGWLPKLLLNRLPMVRGMVDQQNAIRSMNGSAPPGTEIKWGQGGAGMAKYGPANDEIQRLVASAYDVSAHGANPAVLYERMEEAVQAYVAQGKTREEAIKSVATALASKEPVRVLTGREMTQDEERTWVKRMTTEQKADYTRAVNAWALLSRATGKDLGMVTTPGGGGGGSGSIGGIPSPVASPAAMRGISMPSPVAMPSAYRSSGGSVGGSSRRRTSSLRRRTGSRRRSSVVSARFRSPRISRRRTGISRRRRYAAA
jgi:hypothetical protein